MSKRLEKLGLTFLLGAVLMLVANDAMFHFDESLTLIKRKHRSPQRDWNVFYGQKFVFYDSSFRYENDFSAISKIIRPGELVLSDLATSYYAATYLPVYVRNVHHHQGRGKSNAWKKFLQSPSYCNLSTAENIAVLEAFIGIENLAAEQARSPAFRYIIVNDDIYNRNPRFDCFWNQRGTVKKALHKLATKIYQGEYLILYEVN